MKHSPNPADSSSIQALTELHGLVSSATTYLDQHKTQDIEGKQAEKK